MAWHGKCESDTATLCKSNVKDTFYTISGTAWAWHAICESAFRMLHPLRDTTYSSKALVFTSDHGLKNDLEQPSTVMVSMHLYNDESYL